MRLKTKLKDLKSFGIVWCGRLYVYYIYIYILYQLSPHAALCKGLTCIWSCMRLAGSPLSTGRVLGSFTGLGTTVAVDFVNLNIMHLSI